MMIKAGAPAGRIGARAPVREEQVHSGSASGRSAGQTIGVIVLVVVAVVLIVAAVIFFTTPAHSLPSFMGRITHPPHRAHAKRPLHGIAVLVIAVVCLVGAFFVWRGGRRGADDSVDPDAASARG
jgi:amino acid permease